MSRVDSIVRSATRRVVLQRAWRWSGFGFIAGVCAALVVLALDRFNVITVDWWMYAIVACAFAIAAGVSAAFVPITPMAIATRIDKTMRLHDRLGSALAARNKTFIGDDDVRRAFAELTARDADQTAERVDVKRAVPVRYPAVWNIAMVLCIALVLGIALVPRIKAGGEAETLAMNQQVLAQQAAREQLSQSIDQALTNINDESLVDDPGAAEHVDALRDLQEQLTNKEPAERELTEAQQQAAARFNALSEKLEQQAARDQRAMDELAKRFEKLDPANAPPTTREMLEKLREGDYEGAADRLEKLINEAEQLDQAQREQAADSLRKASDEIEKNDEVAGDDAAEREQLLEQALRDRGLASDAIDDVKERAKNASQRELTDELIEKGVDENAARRMAEQLHEDQQREQSKQESDQRAETVRDALNRAADELEQKPESADDPNQNQSADQKNDVNEQQNKDQDQNSKSRDMKKDAQSSQKSGDDTAQEQSPQQQSRQPQSRDGSQPQQKDGQGQQQPSTTGEKKPGTQTGEEQSQGEKQQTGEQPSKQGEKNSSSQQSQGNKPGDQQSGATQENSKQPDEGSGESQQEVVKKEGEASSAQQREQSADDAQRKEQAGGDQQQSEQAAGDTKDQQQPQQPGAVQEKQQQSGGEKQTGDLEQSVKQNESAEEKPGRMREGAKPGAAQDAAKQKIDGHKPGSEEKKQSPSKSAAGDDQKKDIKETGEAESEGDVQKPQQELPKNPSDAIRELAKRRDLADKMKNASEDMKKQAREMAERMTPEQRERWAREFAREMQNQQPNNGINSPGQRSDGQTPGANEPGRPSNYKPEKTETVDSRGPEKDAGMLLDEWLSQYESTANDGMRSSPATERLRSTKEFARRSVNDSTIPARYHKIIEDYFGRLDETVRNATGAAPDDSINKTIDTAPESPGTTGEGDAQP